MVCLKLKSSVKQMVGVIGKKQIYDSEGGRERVSQGVEVDQIPNGWRDDPAQVVVG